MKIQQLTHQYASLYGKYQELHLQTKHFYIFCQSFKQTYNCFVLNTFHVLR